MKKKATDTKRKAGGSMPATEAEARQDGFIGQLDDISDGCEQDAARGLRRKGRGVRLRKMSPEKLLLAAIQGETIPNKCKTRAEREAAMFKIELGDSQRELVDVLLGRRKPRFCDAQNKLHFTFRSMLDFHASVKWGGQARDMVQGVVFMLAQLARQIGSCALEEALRLRIECATSWSYTCARADRLAARFADVWNLVMSEYELLDDKERLRIRVRPPRPTLGFHDNINPYIENDMTAKECTAAERKFALERMRKRLPGYVAAVERKRAAISDAADQISANEPFEGSMEKFLGDFRELRSIFVAETDIYYCVHNDTKYDSDDSLSYAHEKTDETQARESLVAEIGRFLDSAAALARRIGSEAAKEFISAKTILVSRQGDFSTPEADEFCEYSRYCDENEKAEIRDDLRCFLAGFVEAYNGFLKDLAASKLGEKPPVKVELTKKSGETIARAVRPGKGGARRMFDENIQEKCWFYWEKGRKEPAVAESMRESGRKVTRAAVFAYYKRELAALEPPIDTPEAFESALRARTNRLSRSQTRKKSH